MDRMTKEAIRYLGYGRNAVDEQTLALIKDSFEGLRSAVSPKSICRIFDLQHQSEECFQIGNIRMKSRSLGRNLKQCEKLILFGATLGTGADRLITRASLTDMAKAVVLQACAAAMLEEYCDACQREIAKQQEKEGWYLRPRFSPGYGDFALSHQGKFLNAINATKLIGITLSEGGIMIPEKSVSAIMGLSKIDTKCHLEGCEACGNAECQYRI